MKELLNLLRSKEIIVAALFVAIIFIIVLPLPAWMLDFLLIANIAFSLLILLTTLITTTPLQISIFPTLLLVATLFRLSINVASTRMILGTARAGGVINAFGGFVIGNNPVVGLVIFIIITIIQFVVITNGAGRVAEVAARFALDAMPGKQMSIDADLNVGLLSEHQARKRRKDLQRESDFYGAMDGASKFVKGDAIAGIIIALVNIFGGLVIGMAQLGLPFGEAVEIYIMLTVGDGLVSQIPALLISTATGILVTRAGSESSFGNEMISQLFSFPAGVALTSVVLVIMGLVPSLPFLPFMALGGATGYAAWLLKGDEPEVQEAEAEEPPPPQEPEDVLELLTVEQLEIELGFGLLRLADSNQGGDLLARLVGVRRRFMDEMGLYIRPITVKDNLSLSANAYRIMIKGNPVAKSELMPGSFLAMDAGGVIEPISGVETVEPAFGLKAIWVSKDKREEAEMNGYTVVDNTSILITHLMEVVRSHSSEVLGRQEVKEMLDRVKQTQPAVVEDVLADVSLGEIQKVLQSLLAEFIPVKDLATILESIADSARQSKDIGYIVEQVRKALSRAITSRLSGDDGSLRVITLHFQLEQQLLEQLQNVNASQLVLEPNRLEKLLTNIGASINESHWGGREPVLLCSSRLRPALRRLTSRHYSNLSLVAATEVLPETKVEVIGTVTL